MEIQVKQNESLLITEENWPDKIEKLDVDGSLSISNQSDEIKTLELAEGLNVNITGKIFVNGKLVQIAKGTGEVAQEIDCPVENSLPGLWIEDEPGTNRYSLWRCINLGNLDVPFSDFANDEKVGRVFRIEDGKIKFSDSADYACVPQKDCNIMIPNIIIATENGKDASSLASITSSKGGEHTYRYVTFAEVKPNISGAKKVLFNEVAISKSISLTYINDLFISGLVVTTDSSYSSGIIISYCSNVFVKNTTSQSMKSYALSIQYNNGSKIENLKAYTISRDSSTDSSLNINTVSNLDASDILIGGAEVLLTNVNESKINSLIAIDSLKLNNSTSYTQSNIKIDGCNNLIVNNIEIPVGGAAYSSPVLIKNSSKITIANLNSDDDNFNYAAILQVVFGGKLANFKIAGVKNEAAPISLDNRSTNVILQNIDVNSNEPITIGGNLVKIKGITAKDINFMTGAYDSVFAQTYSPDGKGNIIANIMDNKNYQIIEGEPAFSYTGGVDLKKGDVIDIECPFAIRGVTFDGGFNIIGGTSNLRVFAKVKSDDKESDWVLLKDNNLSELNSIISNKSFNLWIRLDASNLNDSEHVRVMKVAINTNDERAMYPIFLKLINITFDPRIRSNPTAKYALIYASTYESGNGVYVRDAEGKPIVGSVNGKNKVTYEYDYDGDSTAGRIPGKDFDVMCICVDNGLLEPIQLKQTITKDDDFNVSFVANIDKAMELYNGL